MSANYADFMSKQITFSANSKVSNLDGHGDTVIEALPGALQDPFAPGQLLDPQMFIWPVKSGN